MTIAAYSSLFDDVLPELPGADLPIVLHQIKRACNDFYERSLYSREDVVPINIVALTNTYTVAPTDPTNFQVGKILEVRINDGSSGAPRKIWPRTQHQLDTELPNWDTLSGTPTFYTQSAIDNVILAWVPDTSYTAGLLVKIAKLPQYTGAGIDQPIFDKFNESLALGVKGRMMRMPKKPWTNLSLGNEYLQEFNLEVAAAAAIAAKAYGAGPLRTRAYG